MDIKLTDADVNPLKKCLFRFWEIYQEEIFLFTGAIVAGVTYRRLYEIAAKYRISAKTVDSYLVRNLKHNDCKELRNCDEVFSKADVALSLHYLVAHTDLVKYFPAIYRLKTLRKYFAEIPKKITPLMAKFLEAPFNDSFSLGVAEKDAREYFRQCYKFTDADFNQLIIEIFQARTFKNKHGDNCFSLLDLCQYEKILVEESSYKLDHNDFVDALHSLFSKGANSDDK